MFKQIENDSNGKLDLLVNNCYAAVGRILGAVDKPIDKFWECDPLMWDEFNDVGLRAGFDQLGRLFIRFLWSLQPYLRAHYVASVYAARIMVPNGSGLIVNMSSSGGIMHMASAAYGIGKAAKDRMAQDFNKELDGTGWDPQ